MKIQFKVSVIITALVVVFILVSVNKRGRTILKSPDEQNKESLRMTSRDKQASSTKFQKQTFYFTDSLKKGSSWPEHIEKVCKRLELNQMKQRTRHFKGHRIVNHQYKIFYCQIPKVACTNWRRVLLILSGKSPVSDPLSLTENDVHVYHSENFTEFYHLSNEEKKIVLETYFKFIIVRNPFEKLLSAYQHKMTKNIDFYNRKFGIPIIKKFRKNPSAEALAKGNDVTFLEFVKYTVDPSRTVRFDSHWEHMFNLCQPCSIKYDFVGKIHQMEADAKYILDTINASSVVKFPSRSSTYKNKKTEDILRQYYEMIPSPVLDLLWQSFQPDLQLFNYTVPDSIKDLTTSWN